MRAARVAIFFAWAVLAATATATAAGAETKIVPGPVPAHVRRVIDGDTIAVVARIWPGHYVETHVRLAEIDAPELRGKCPAETAGAERARARLSELVASGRISLSDVHFGKYAGRVVARVATEDGRDAGAVLVAEGLARKTRRGRRLDWCARASGP